MPSYALPVIPLTGKEHFEQWVRDAIRFMNEHKLVDSGFDKPNFPPGPTGKEYVFSVLEESLKHVRTEIKQAGCDFSDVNPMRLFLTVLELDSLRSNAAKAAMLMHKFVNATPAHYTTPADPSGIRTYLRRMQDIRDQLEESHHPLDGLFSFVPYEVILRPQLGTLIRISNMEAPSMRTVPEIPALKGEENFPDWERKLMETLRCYGLREYLPGSVTVSLNNSNQIIKTHANKAFVLGLILGSITPVLARLQDTGRDLIKTDQDPEDVYKLIKKHFVPLTFNRGRRLAKYLRNLSTKPSEIGLSAWKALIESSKRALDLEGVPVNTNLAIYAIIDAVEADFPELHSSLLREKHLGKLTWSRLMTKIAVKTEQDQ